MPHPGNHLEPFAICRLLRNVTPEGPVLGLYDDEPIYANIRDEWGRRYGFSGVVGRGGGLRLSGAGLKRGEFLLPPGVIYQMNVKRNA